MDKCTFREEMVSARQLHKDLNIGRDFVTWIKGRIDNYGFNDEIDFYRFEDRRGIRNNVIRYDYFITVDMAKALCRIERKNPKAGDILKKLYSYENKEVVIKEQPRLEYQFEKMLLKITGMDFIKQFGIDGGKYRLDFYIPNLLIVEYDEYYHNSQIEEDAYRMQYCQRWLIDNGYNDKECKVIRVKQGFELEGIGEIVKYIYEGKSKIL